MGLLVQLPNLAGVRRPATAAAVPWSFRSGRLTVSAAATGGPVKEEEEEEKGAGKKEKVVIRVSDPVRERRLPPPLFSVPEAPSEPSPAPSMDRRRNEVGDEEEGKRRYYVNMGDAIRKLRGELPVVFYREPSFDIYRLHWLHFSVTSHPFLALDEMLSSARVQFVIPISDCKNC